MDENMTLTEVFLLQKDTGDGRQTLAVYSTFEATEDVRKRLVNASYTRIDEFVINFPAELLGYEVTIDPDGSVFDSWDRIRPPRKSGFQKGSRNDFGKGNVITRIPLSRIFVAAPNFEDAKTKAQEIHRHLRDELGEITGTEYPVEWTSEAVHEVLKKYDIVKRR